VEQRGGSSRQACAALIAAGVRVCARDGIKAAAHVTHRPAARRGRITGHRCLGAPAGPRIPLQRCWKHGSFICLTNGGPDPVWRDLCDRVPTSVVGGMWCSVYQQRFNSMRGC
jgi:hypothetical protein